MKLNLDKKIAGIFVPCFSLRTDSDLGIGDTEGVRQMIDWCAKHGISVLQLLPINETNNDNSPYNTISSIALEPTTIAITPKLIPDLSAKDYKAILANQLLEDLRNDSIDYTAVRALKRSLLDKAFQSFAKSHWKKNTPRAQLFRAFLLENADWISYYSFFRTLSERHLSPVWDRWPAEHRGPKRAWSWFLSLPKDEQDQFSHQLLFASYCQWIAFDQWAKLKKYGSDKQVYLMGDIPFGISRYSADVWSNREIFDLSWSGGAPPERYLDCDPFTQKWGQNWGIPLYDWDTMKRRDFEWWRSRVRNVSKMFHTFRIDHALGFYRIYSLPWTPDQNGKFLPMNEQEVATHTGGRLPGFIPFADDSPEHCHANQTQGELLLSMVKETAPDTVVIAEDLGMVPAYVPGSLEKLQIPGFKIPHFLRNDDRSFVDGKDYPRLSLATPATHDHLPIASIWSDLWDRVEAGNNGDDTAKYYAGEALGDLKQWMKYGGAVDEEPPREFNDHIHEIMLRGVINSNSWLVVFMITDVFGIEDRFNVPGAVDASNWSYRMKHKVSEFDKTPMLLQKTKLLEKLLKKSKRFAAKKESYPNIKLSNAVAGIPSRSLVP